eukprot:4725828-Pyramimonas_sp.AAC.1
MPSGWPNPFKILQYWDEGERRGSPEYWSNYKRVTGIPTLISPAAEEVEATIAGGKLSFCGPSLDIVLTGRYVDHEGYEFFDYQAKHLQQYQSVLEHFAANEAAYLCKFPSLARVAEYSH